MKLVAMKTTKTFSSLMTDEISSDEEGRKDTESQNRDSHKVDWLPTMNNRSENKDETESDASYLCIKFLTSQDDPKTAVWQGKAFRIPSKQKLKKSTYINTFIYELNLPGSPFLNIPTF